MRRPIGSIAMSTLLVLTGILVGVACSDDIGAMAEEVADTVAAMVAADVTYDPATSQLVATDVQAALDELDQRLDDAPDTAGVQATVEEAVQSGVAAVESRVNALEGADYAATLAALTERVEALEAKMTPVQTAVQVLQGKDVGLQEALDALDVCDADFYDLGPSCMMETTVGPGPADWFTASYACVSSGFRLCDFAEHLSVCGIENFDTTDEPEWTGTVLGPDSVLLSQMGKGSCYDQLGVVETGITLTNKHPFRCCYTK